ncbi:MAG: 3-phosphoshikimate 1-carboxyvinyltransferase [Candidatus Altiarchaeales archaeon]|nr:3-phosphoshikimate 1-carboxyvinyltransferase [Candidatus Altiarchaeales archaeon]MBD3416651.1 3-phosphoshikimate 1-carboxyvinyltransferase [Candidatus Altiarchaeales archaeon]
MELKVKPSESLGGVVSAPPSKSYTIRAVLSSLLADGSSTIRSPLVSRDTMAAFNACRLLGGRMLEAEGLVEVDGVGGKPAVPGSKIDALNSGTTIRIATAIASLCGGPVTLTGDESICRRPIQPLLDALSQLGVNSRSESGFPPVTVEGPLEGGLCSIPGDVSSQYITALLMASPYAGEDVTVELTTGLKSRPYVDLTLDMLARFKVEVYNDGYKSFHVPAGQSYSPVDYTVEGDYSSGAFILAAAALTDSEVTVNNLFRDSLQADRKIAEIISKMGAKVGINDDSVSVVSDGRLHGIRADLSDSPDLVPIVSVLGALSEGETEIFNAAHARLKECDRIEAMASELSKMGCEVEERDDGLLIQGGVLKGSEVDGWMDHRIIMSLAVAGLKAEGETVISGAEHLDVTFPDFKEVLGSLGGVLV